MPERTREAVPRARGPVRARRLRERAAGGRRPPGRRRSTSSSTWASTAWGSTRMPATGATRSSCFSPTTGRGRPSGRVLGRVPLPDRRGRARGASRRCAGSSSGRSSSGCGHAGAGRCSRCSRPSTSNKGTAVRALLAERGLRRGLYAGDDATDLEAFRGLDGLELAVRVAVVSEEGPSELAEAADLVVDVDRGARRAAAPALMHLTDEILAPIRARYGEPAMLEWEGEISEREHGIATYDPRADARRHALHPQRRPPRADPQASVPAGHLAAARRRRQAGRGLRRGGRAGGVRGDRPPGRARAVPRRGEGAVPLLGRRLDWRTHVFLATTEDDELDRHDTDEIAEARWGTLEELAGRSGSACSRPGARSGATASRCTTRRLAASDRARTRPCRSRASAPRRGE